MMKHIVITLLALLAGTKGAYAMETTEHAIFAGGCFWCMESEFEGTKGVISVTSGYTGGHTEAPTYEAVSQEDTGHAEAVEVVYNPAEVSYEKLLDIYWGNIDPTDAGGQFHDRGDSYRTAIFYVGEKQHELAEFSKKQAAERLKQEIHTQIVPASTFYPAEEYHQDYHRKNELRYNAYKNGSGREQRLKEIWRK